ncbi:MAG: hypothetical protein JO194_04215 [Candidatus Eremiobacteraeota bacterium]|nr:hypothetical protein [Candidatus Eremiobacteraeota bacterium]
MTVRGRREEFAKIEQRRREYLGDAPAGPLPRRAVPPPRRSPLRPFARAGAGAALATTLAMLAFSLIVAGNDLASGPDITARSTTPSRARVADLTFKGERRAAVAPRVVAHVVPRLTNAQKAHVPAQAPARPSGTAGRTAKRPLAIAAAPIRPAQPLRATGSGISIEARPWQLTADGTWRTEVVAFFDDGSGAQQPRLHAQVTFNSDRGETVGLDPWLHQTPSAMVTTRAPAAVQVDATALEPSSGSATLTLPAPPTDPASFAATTRVIGPHLVVVGWTPLSEGAGVRGYRVYRVSAEGARTLIALASSHAHSWRDTSVAANGAYEYDVEADLGGRDAVAVARAQTPVEMADTDIGAIAGKGMFLFFSPDTSDRNSYAQFDPDEVVAQAVKAGVSDIELRVSRGTFAEAANPEVRAWLDRLIDAASAAGIKLIAWSVPRRNTADDVAESIEMAQYRTAAGNGFAGLALDLEPGDEYMGHGAVARERIADYMEMARQAVGPDYLLIATVISPRMTHFTNDDYPYSRIARYASVMQPMEYWHHFRASHAYAQTDVADNCSQAVALTRTLAGRNVPVNVAGQSADLGRTGAPSPAELGWCLGAAQAAGAIGEMFFDYQGTTPQGWSAIESYRW